MTPDQKATFDCLGMVINEPRDETGREIKAMVQTIVQNPPLLTCSAVEQRKPSAPQNGGAVQPIAHP